MSETCILVASTTGEAREAPAAGLLDPTGVVDAAAGEEDEAQAAPPEPGRAVGAGVETAVVRAVAGATREAPAA